MKNFIIQLIVLFSWGITSFTYAQDKEINFIIRIDGELKQVYCDEIILNYSDNKESIKVSYIPGNLVVDQKDYDKILSNEVESITFKAKYIEHCGDDTEYYNYKIENFNKNWLIKGSFFILNIYNTDKKKYKKIYDPLPEKNFTFDYDWSEGSMRRVQKKKSQKQKKCS